MAEKRKILITGGAGFIGSHLIRHFVTQYPDYEVYNLDKLTYAGNLENLRDIEGASNYHFLKADIADEGVLVNYFEEYQFDDVLHLAAESHVDRSIESPKAFIDTNIGGTVNLLNAALDTWKKDWANNSHAFLQVSTDEVFGSLGATGYFNETTPYDPRSPYSASKASADHMVRAYHHTYGLPVKIANCSNNYGPFQFPEKLIPVMINNIREEKPLPVYGEGANVRDWLYVKDHVHALDLIFHKAKNGSTYTIGGKNEWSNLELVKLLCRIMDQKLERQPGHSESLISFVQDRAGHDLRYAIDPSKIENELGWRPSVNFEKGLEITVDWYLANEDWMQKVTKGT